MMVISVSLVWFRSIVGSCGVGPTSISLDLCKNNSFNLLRYRVKSLHRLKPIECRPNTTMLALLHHISDRYHYHLDIGLHCSTYVQLTVPVVVAGIYYLFRAADRPFLLIVDIVLRIVI